MLIGKKWLSIEDNLLVLGLESSADYGQCSSLRDQQAASHMFLYVTPLEQCDNAASKARHAMCLAGS